MNNLPRFKYVTLGEYQALGAKDANTLYFIKNTGLLYKGSELYGSTVKQVAGLPDAQDAIPGMLYVISEGDSAGIYTRNAAGDDFEMVAASAKYVEKALAETFVDVDYDSDSAKLTLEKANGEKVIVDLPKENFLANVSFNNETAELTLVLESGSETVIDLSDLVNLYDGGDTQTIRVSVDSEGMIKANVVLSEDSTNALRVESDGLYAPKPTAAIDETATNDRAAGAKAVYDLLAEMAWSETL